MPSPLDLAQLRAFVHLYETRSVTATAELLHVTQPSVSYTLAKLRRRFDEELFVRVPGGLEPTATATELYLPLRSALEGIDRAVAAPGTFDAATSGREFTVMLSDFGELSFLPLLLTRFAALAPHARLRVQRLVVDSAADELVRGRLDLAVTSADLGSEHLVRRPFMVVDYAVLAARGHRRVGATLTTAQFAAERFVNVRGTTGHLGPVELIERLALESRVELELTGFAAVPYVVAASELLAIVPRHIADIYAARHDVVVLDLPWPVAPIEVAAHTRRSPGLARQWLADLVVDTLTSVRLA